MVPRLIVLDNSSKDIIMGLDELDFVALIDCGGGFDLPDLGISGIATDVAQRCGFSFETVEIVRVCERSFRFVD